VNNIASGAYAHAEGYDRFAFGDYSHVEGYTPEETKNVRYKIITYEERWMIKFESYPVTIFPGYLLKRGDKFITLGDNFDYFTFYIKSTGGSSMANSTDWETCSIYGGAIGKYSHAEGEHTLAYGSCCHTEGSYTRTS
jgi:hypothetical protein